jgi:hypothetical protein
MRIVRLLVVEVVVLGLFALAGAVFTSASVRTANAAPSCGGCMVQKASAR